MSILKNLCSAERGYDGSDGQFRFSQSVTISDTWRRPENERTGESAGGQAEPTDSHHRITVEEIKSLLRDALGPSRTVRIATTSPAFHLDLPRVGAGHALGRIRQCSALRFVCHRWAYLSAPHRKGLLLFLRGRQL